MFHLIVRRLRRRSPAPPRYTGASGGEIVASPTPSPPSLLRLGLTQGSPCLTEFRDRGHHFLVLRRKLVTTERPPSRGGVNVVPSMRCRPALPPGAVGRVVFRVLLGGGRGRSIEPGKPRALPSCVPLRCPCKQLSRLFAPLRRRPYAANQLLLPRREWRQR